MSDTSFVYPGFITQHGNQKPGFSLDKVVLGAPQHPKAEHWLGSDDKNLVSLYVSGSEILA